MRNVACNLVSRFSTPKATTKTLETINNNTHYVLVCRTIVRRSVSNSQGFFPDFWGRFFASLLDASGEASVKKSRNVAPKDTFLCFWVFYVIRDLFIMLVCFRLQGVCQVVQNCIAIFCALRIMENDFVFDGFE